MTDDVIPMSFEQYCMVARQLYPDWQFFPFELEHLYQIYLATEANDPDMMAKAVENDWWNTKLYAEGKFN